jgi:hypothetical protein
VEDVLANLFLPESMFINDDFPTFERPINAYSGKLGSGHLFTSCELIIKFA